MKICLTPNEARVLGALIEKEITTPEQYPLSLNALTNACNQKSNREPVVSWAESEVCEIVDELVKKRLVKENSGFGSRVVKYKHWFCNTEFGDLKLSEQELGIICILFLRGPQTPGELRTRTNRLCQFADALGVEKTLHQLMLRQDGPFVLKLAREPGKRESRYAHLFCEKSVRDDNTEKDGAKYIEKGIENNDEQVRCVNRESLNGSQHELGADRIAVLEQQVFELQNEVRAIKAQLAEWLD